MEHRGAGADRALEEHPHGYPIGRGECDVRLPEAFTCRLGTDPEVRLRRDAIPHDVTEVHDSLSTERRKDLRHRTWRWRPRRHTGWRGDQASWHRSTPPPISMVQPARARD